MANEIEFVKMEGLGNDFVIIDVRPSNKSINQPELSTQQIIRIADRHVRENSNINNENKERRNLFSSYQYPRFFFLLERNWL